MVTSGANSVTYMMAGARHVPMCVTKCGIGVINGSCRSMATGEKSNLAKSSANQCMCYVKQKVAATIMLAMK